MSYRLTIRDIRDIRKVRYKSYAKHFLISYYHLSSSQPIKIKRKFLQRKVQLFVYVKV